MTVRPAAPADVPRLVALVRDLAAYERAADEVELTAAALHAHLFPATGEPAVFAHVAEQESEPLVIGMALWFKSFSTWTGTHGIWLEDLYVDPAARGQGHGKALLAALAATAVARGWLRVEWAVLDWNTPALDFYRSLAADPLAEWTTQRLSGTALERLAGLGENV